MSRKNVNFGGKKIKQSKFYKIKEVIKIDDIDVKKILVSKQEPYGSKSSFKYFIGYIGDDAIKPLCIQLPQMIGYFRNFGGNRTMSFKISVIKLLKKYNKVWKKAEKFLKTKFDSEPVYGDNDKYIKTKIKIYDDSLNTNFKGKSVPKEKGPFKCLSIIMLDSVVKVEKKHYPQTLLEECKYEPKKIKMENPTDDDLEKSSSDESDNEDYNDSNDEMESDNENDESNE